MNSTGAVALSNLLLGLGDLEREARARRASEFSHGVGLVAPQLADNDPAHGGRYRARAASENPGPPRTDVCGTASQQKRAQQYPNWIWP